MFKYAASCILAVLACSAFLPAADPFLGEWKADLNRSRPDPNHRPTEARLRFEATPDGYRMTASGICCDGQAVSQTVVFYPDGKEHATPEAKTTVLVRRLGARTLETIAKSDGQEVGRGIYEVSEDGKTLTATVAGQDAEHHSFQTMMLFERQ